MKKNSTAMERLLKEGFFETREAALPYLMSGAVYCGAVQVTTGGQKVPLDKPITVRGLDDRYVSKGGYKLEGAIADFGIDVTGRVCIDAGACTGGFTDCLVKHGAQLVYAVEVGFGQLAGSLALTMTSFMPELDAVRVMVNNDPVTMCDMGDGIVQFPDGLIRREHFAGRVGSTATLYLVDGANEFRAIERAVSTRAALSPRRLLEELLSYAGADGEALRLPLSARLNPDDLLGVQTVGGVARVNLSASFYRSCQGLSPRAERDLVYAIVNTLCAMEGIRGVRFFIEGRAADTLAGTIYLKSVLLPNPGIVAGDDAA